MKRAGLLLAVLLCAPPAAAQRSSADQLRQARALYDRLELERAARTLRELLAPQWTSPLAAEQRVDALTLLGATLVLIGRVDSGVVSFRQALQLDPFTDLEPDEYTPAQVGAFARARRQVLAIAVRRVAATRVDPRVQRVTFPYATTHAADVRAELSHAGSVVATFEAAGEGPAELIWNGLGPDGRLAPSGRYELRLRAASRVISRADSTVTYFDLQAETEALEDTLPALLDLLPERTPGSAGAGELGKGLAVAGGVVLIAGPLSGSALGRDDGAGPAVVAVVGILAGVVAFTAARRQRDLPANTSINRGRQEERRTANEAIRARNAARLAATVLVLTPAAGVGP